MDCARHCPQCGLDSERTQNGRLPPWELAKALAFHTVIAAVCDHLGQVAPELLDSGRKSNSERAAGGRQSGEWQPGGAVAEGCKLYTFLIDSGRGAKCGIWDSGGKSNSERAAGGRQSGEWQSGR